MSLDVYLSPPGCPHCGRREDEYSSNITHNLGAMARAAGIYKELWRPEEIGVTKAAQLIKPLTDGIARLKADPDHFKQFDTASGWGTFEQFVPWLEEYLAACNANPDAAVSVSR